MMRGHKPNLQDKYIVCRHAAPSYKKYDACDMRNESAGSKGSRGRCGRVCPLIATQRNTRRHYRRVCPLIPGVRGSVPLLLRNEIRGVITEGSVPFLSTKLADGDKGRSRKSKEHEHYASKPPLGQLWTEQHLHEECAEKLANALKGHENAHAHRRKLRAR